MGTFEHGQVFAQIGQQYLQITYARERVLMLDEALHSIAKESKECTKEHGSKKNGQEHLNEGEALMNMH